MDTEFASATKNETEIHLVALYSVHRGWTFQNTVVDYYRIIQIIESSSGLYIVFSPYIVQQMLIPYFNAYFSKTLLPYRNLIS